MDFTKIHPDAVKFDKTVCCAFAHLLTDVSDIKETYIEKIGEKGKRWVNIFLQIFNDTSFLHFIPSQTHIEFYTDVATKECEHLKTATGAMLCGHSPEEHIEALSSIIQKLNRGTRH